ncbi:7753_t:CDS:2 [Paraglomus occultum]|uniref:7753_t:CDS:1 n=1 Tax=Paraglomus occultum TaxID=144539 RepID=A0A9N9C7A2_9GLOM|nr:7753_t:CDS:2 [Paraglomus occultum]
MSSLIDSDYVSESSLANLRLYKYASIDKSPLSKYILRPYWDWAVKLFPMWMAPNLITLCGLGFILVNLVCVMVFLPDLVGPGAPWLYYSFAAGLWLYQTFDNVDGRQARRTKSSSPLGELFDHGCDALNCSFGAIVHAAAMGLGHSWYSAFLLLVTTLPFYLSTWEEYHTGILYLGYINGPTEGLVIACIMMILSGIFGPGIWLTDIRELFGEGIPEFIPKGYHLVDVMVFFMAVGMIFIHTPASLYHVYKACAQRSTSFLATLPQLFSIVLYSLCGYLWLASPHSYIFRDQHFILFALTTGIVFGRVATKIILAHVTKMPFPMYTVLLIPLLVGALLTNIPVWLKTDTILTPKAEYYYLWSYFGFAAIAYTHWANLVISRFCSYLGINCLTIPASKKQI